MAPIKKALPTTALAVALIALVAMPAQARFQVRCMPSHVATVDPIVAPGLSRSAHEHEFFGNTSTGALSTYDEMLTASTTCSTADDTAAYWTPTLLGPDGSPVAADSLLIYYRGNAETQPFPADLRIISSDVTVGPDNPSNLIVRFPECWDGVHIDSPDHMSHMVAVAAHEPCPDTHPVRLPEVTEVFRYPVADVSSYELSSGPLATAHADFWNTWDQGGLTVLVERCLNVADVDCGRIDS